MKLRFLTGNQGKVAELQALLGPGVHVVPDGRGYPEIQADTLEAVARHGARHLLDTGMEGPFILEDSGLFIDAVQGFPGVYSRHVLDTIGCAGILRLLEGVCDDARTARFGTYLLYADAEGALHAFEGRCEGSIAHKAQGTAGFGFDPIFIPRGHRRTFAQMDASQKGDLSHRGEAVRAFAAAWQGLEKTANR